MSEQKVEALNASDLAWAKEWYGNNSASAIECLAQMHGQIASLRDEAQRAQIECSSVIVVRDSLLRTNAKLIQALKDCAHDLRQCGITPEIADVLLRELGEQS